MSGAPPTRPAYPIRKAVNRQRIEQVSVLDETGTLHQEMTVVIESGLIVSIVPYEQEESSREWGNEECIDGTGQLLTPGLVNLHTHTPMNIFRGIAEDVDADTWFNRDIWPYESIMEEEDIRIGALLAMAEMMNNGVTACADHYFGSETICAAAAAVGMRLDIAPTLFGMAGGFSGQLEAAEQLFADWNDSGGLIRVRMGPHSPYTCSPEELALAAETAGRLGTGAHLHLAETREQVKNSLREYGKTPFQVARDAGLFNLPLIIAHGIYLTEEDRLLLDPQLQTMAVSPKTYLKLGMGIGHLLDRSDELPLAVGTDGAASSNTLNPLEQARLLGLLGKDHAGTGAAWDARQIWSILMRGHSALSFGTGCMQPGAPADLVLWDLNTVGTAPVYHPLSTLIYSADSRNVRAVWIGGELVKADGKLLLDEKGLTEEAAGRARSLLKRGRGTTKLVF